MKFKKLCAAVLAAIVTVSMSACGNDNTAETTTTASETTTTAAITTAATTTSATTTEAETKVTEAPVSGDNSDAESVKVYYGWGQDEEEYTAIIYCPEGAEFSDYTLESYAEEGLLMSANLEDEANEYSVTSNSYWHPDAYTNDDMLLSILQQLYFNGEIDAATAEEYSNCSQKVTPLGFKWNGYDVIMLETSYTFLDYGEQTDIFIGVEYDLKYWEVDDETYEAKDLTTKGLFGFDAFYYGWDEITQEHWAWIAGELFGVDTGIENPFAKDSNEEQIPADIDPSALLGKWCDKSSDWEDTYFFDYNDNGSYTSGFENTFTWSVEGNVLTVFYAEDDIESFAATVNENELVLIDKFGYEQRFEKVVEEDETETDTETDSGTDEEVNPNIIAIIGTWKENTTGYDETFTFNTDGTGHYSCLNDEGGTYECAFTYEFFRSDYVDIYYDDGDIGGFLIAIDGDELTVRNDFVWDLTYTRQ